MAQDNILDYIYIGYGHLLKCFNQPWLSLQQRSIYFYLAFNVIHDKFQSAVAPNGLIAVLDGRYKGNRHNRSMLAGSNSVTKLNNHSYTPHHEPVYLYGDSAYHLRVHLQKCPLFFDYKKF